MRYSPASASQTAQTVPQFGLRRGNSVGRQRKSKSLSSIPSSSVKRISFSMMPVTRSNHFGASGFAVSLLSCVISPKSPRPRRPKKCQPLWRRSPQQKLRSHAAEHRRLLVLVSRVTRQLKNERNGIAKREFVRTQIPSTGVSHALSVRFTPLAVRINCRARSGARRAGSSPR